jgi:hypothetical protein
VPVAVEVFLRYAYTHPLLAIDNGACFDDFFFVIGNQFYHINLASLGLILILEMAFCPPMSRGWCVSILDVEYALALAQCGIDV